MQTNQPIATALLVRFLDSSGKEREAHDNGAYFNGQKVLAIRSGGFATLEYLRDNHQIIAISGVVN